jgi:hypothetical protein
MTVIADEDGCLPDDPALAVDHETIWRLDGPDGPRAMEMP